MKKLFALVLITPVLAYGQQTPGLKLGVKLCPQTTWLINQQDSDAGPEFDPRVSWGVAFGADAGWFFSESIGLGLELLYGTTTQNFDVFDTLFAKKLTYLKIPLLLQFASNGDGAANFLGQVGPQANLLMSSSLEDGAGAAVPDSAAYSSMTFGLDLFLGMTINLGVIDIVTGLRLDYAFGDAEDKSAGMFPAGRGPLRAATGGLVIGARIGLGG